MDIQVVPYLRLNGYRRCGLFRCRNLSCRHYSVLWSDTADKEARSHRSLLRMPWSCAGGVSQPRAAGLVEINNIHSPFTFATAIQTPLLVPSQANCAVPCESLSAPGKALRKAERIEEGS
ncbi:hypothetical protein KC363_g234 [Hortaea werneckii]|nr:hypothetical protein KC363_g234 [Hortaea werneckii]